MLLSNEYPIPDTICFTLTLFSGSVTFRIPVAVMLQSRQKEHVCSPPFPFNYRALAWKGIRISVYRLIAAYLLKRVNCDKIMHVRWDFEASSAQTRRVSALDKHQNWSASALFCHNSRTQSKYAVVNLIHTQQKQTFLSFIMW